MRQSLEHNAQVALFQWAALEQRRLPELAMLFAVPNAARRTPRQGAWMKQEGLKAGCPDIFLPVSHGKHHGMAIEMKAGKNKPTESQRWWHYHLSEQGFHVVVCYSFDEARIEIERYLAQPRLELR